MKWMKVNFSRWYKYPEGDSHLETSKYYTVACHNRSQAITKAHALAVKDNFGSKTFKYMLTPILNMQSSYDVNITVEGDIIIN